ncbi:MAG: hypothetical protein AAGM67_22115, partial [Bacteroidota bacterium]
IFEDTRVLDVETERIAGGQGMRKATAVVTEKGTIKAGKVVNCMGMWARDFGRKLGVCIPNQAAEHYYLLTGLFINRNCA